MKAPTNFLTRIQTTGLLSLILLSVTSMSIYSQWRKHMLDPQTEYTVFFKAHDIDNDGDMDLFVTDEAAGNILFYENNNDLSWIRHVVDGSGGGPHGLDIADIDNDGHMDLLATFYITNSLVWFRNNGDTPIQWTKDTIDNSPKGPSLIHAADINGDGALDAVAKWYNSGEIKWFENKLPDGWTSHLISLDFSGYSYISINDINEDGKSDIIATTVDRNKIVLFKNNFPDENWSEIIIDDQLPGAFGVYIGDIDNDGDLDIGASSQSDMEPAVAWYENQGTGQEWIRHDITLSFNYAGVLGLADFDSNGFIDMVVGERTGKKLVYLLNEDGGQNWTEYVVDENLAGPNVAYGFDIDQDNDFDIISTRTKPGALYWYENPFGTAHAATLLSLPTLIQSTSDTLKVTARLNNPNNHQANAWAVITGDQSGFSDTLQLFDDGIHSDGDSSDNVWGNVRLTTDLLEDEYYTDLYTYDSTDNDTLGFASPAWFFTLGPVDFEEYITYRYFPWEDAIPNPGESINLQVALKNNSTMATATNLKVELSSLDSSITIKNTLLFEDIPAGQSTVSTNECVVWIDSDCPVDTEIPILISISSHGNLCWQDTFTFVVYNPVKVNDYKKAQVRIYPNPAGDLITIETRKPGHLWIEIYSLNGQLLFSDRREGPTHQINLSSFQKGVYLVTIRSDDFIQTRKLIKTQ